eukprot:7641364-Heterocapsa_arctica.AAC.1
MAYTTGCGRVFYNSEDFKVVYVTETYITLRSDNVEIGAIELRIDEMKMFKPMYAMTVHKC